MYVSPAALLHTHKRNYGSKERSEHTRTAAVILAHSRYDERS
jgi:hypothetical protein